MPRPWACPPPPPAIPRVPWHDGTDIPTDHIAWRLFCMGQLSSAPSLSPCPCRHFEMMAYEMSLWILSSALANRTPFQAGFYWFEICKARPLCWGCC